MWRRSSGSTAEDSGWKWRGEKEGKLRERAAALLEGLGVAGGGVVQPVARHRWDFAATTRRRSPNRGASSPATSIGSVDRQIGASTAEASSGEKLGLGLGFWWWIWRKKTKWVIGARFRTSERGGDRGRSSTEFGKSLGFGILQEGGVVREWRRRSRRDGVLEVEEKDSGKNLSGWRSASQAQAQLRHRTRVATSRHAQAADCARGEVLLQQGIGVGRS